MNILISLAAFLAAIAVLITVHEFGHFAVARVLGVKVLRFSIGFGRPLIRWRRGEGTEYVIAALPLGGYVKPLDEREGPVPEGELDRALNRRPRWQRAAVLVAGPGFNFLFAFIAYWIVFMVGVPGLKPVLGNPPPQTPAARAGLVSHDMVQAVNGSLTPTWESVQLALLEAVVAERPLVLRVAEPSGKARSVRLDYGSAKQLTQPGALLPGLGLSPWLPPLPPVLGKIEANSPAEEAGLQSGDRVTAIGNTNIGSWDDLRHIVQRSAGKRLVFHIERNGRSFVLPIVPESRKVNAKVVGQIGAEVSVPENYAQTLKRTLGAANRLAPVPALSASFHRAVQVTALTAVMLYRMASGGASLSNLGGPIVIAQDAGAWAQAGLTPFLFFLGVFSIGLGILNLLPIPLLDGGQLLYLAIEFVRGRPLSERAEAIGQRIGLSLIVLLLGFAVFNDLSRLLNP